MAKRSDDRPESYYTERSEGPRPESCYTAASYDPTISDATTGHKRQWSFLEDKFIALRLTRARLWVVCVFLSLLHADELMPKGQASGLDKEWKKAWLSEVQTPLNAMIVSIDAIADADMAENLDTISEDIKQTFKLDAETLMKKIGDELRSKTNSTPKCELQDKVMGVRLVRTMLLFIGELLGDLGQDFMIPTFTDDNSLLKRDAEINKSNRRKNLILTAGFKENLIKMQDHMASKAYDLQNEEPELYAQRIGDKSLAECCDADAEEIENNILVPFADECNSWDVARPGR